LAAVSQCRAGPVLNNAQEEEGACCCMLEVSNLMHELVAGEVHQHSVTCVRLALWDMTWRGDQQSKSKGFDSNP